MTVAEAVFAQVFTERTLATAAALALAYGALLAAFDLLGGHLCRLLSPSAWLAAAAPLLPLVGGLLLRLRPIALPESLSVRSLVNVQPLLTAAAWAAATAAFVAFYFARYAPAYLVIHAHPEGKYGPPLLREQPFILLSFALYAGLAAYLRCVWRYKNVIVHHMDPKTAPSFGHLALRLRLPHTLRRILDVVAITWAVVLVENFTTGPLAYLLYGALTTALMGAGGGSHRHDQGIRAPAHSPWEMLDAPLLWHLAWCGAFVATLFAFTEVAVEYFFGQPFNICQRARLANPNPVLLHSLQSPRVAIKNEAIIELHQLLRSEPAWRQSLFVDFYTDDVAVSRLLAQFFAENVTAFTRHIVLLNNDLAVFSKEFDRRIAAASAPTAKVGAPPFSPLPGLSGRADMSLGGALGAAPSSIFSPKSKTLFESLIDPLLEKGAPVTDAPRGPDEGRPSSFASGQSQGRAAVASFGLPSVFRVQRGDSPVVTSSGGGAQPEGSLVHGHAFASRHLKLAALCLSRTAPTLPGQVYGALACEIVKSWWLHQDEPFIWLLESLAAFVVASYEEDRHGQVQLCLDALITALLDLAQALATFEALPAIDGGAIRLTSRIFATQESPTEARSHRIRACAIGALEDILERFADCIDEVKLGGETRERLRNFDLGLSL